MSNKYPGNFITADASTGYSIFSNGSGYLSSSGTVNWSSYTNLTIETWIYPTNVANGTQAIVGTSQTGSDGYSFVYFYSDGRLGVGITGTNEIVSAAGTIKSNTWQHVAVVKTGSTTTMYVNGISVATGTTGVWSNNTRVVWIGAGAGVRYLGYISNLRLSLGTALYSGTSTTAANFNLPTQFINNATTSLLTCQSPTFVDNSTNAYTITTTNYIVISSFAPFGAYQGLNPALGSGAPGIWTLDQAAYLQANRLWPIYDPYYNYTTLMMHGNGANGAQNNTFLDSSTNNFTITRNGNTTQGTFTPFSQPAGYWTAYSNTSSSYVQTPASSLATITGGNLTATSVFTAEGWFNLPGSMQIWGDMNPTANNTTFAVSVNSSGNPTLGYFNGSSFITSTSTGAITFNTWVHIAWVVNTGTVYFYINGIAAGTGSVGTASGSTGYTAFFGANNSFAAGYISNFRVTRAVRYTSNFAPSTTPLTADANTSLLVFQNNRFVDNSTNNFTLTGGAGAVIQPQSPFNVPVPYDVNVVGGSGYFNGSTDYLSVPANSAFTFPSNFTIEAWVYITGTPSTSDAFIATNNAVGGWGFKLLTTTGNITLACDDRSSAYFGTTTQLKQNTWYHVAWVHFGATTGDYLYINGVMSGSSSGRSLSAASSTTTIGAANVNNYYVPGYITNVRIIKGQALVTAGNNFTPPTSPTTATTVGWTGANVATSITGTVSLLTSCTNAGIYDNTCKNVFQTVDAAQVSTTQSKYGGASISCVTSTASGAYPVASANNNIHAFYTGDFTVEAWIYLTTSTFDYSGSVSVINYGSGGANGPLGTATTWTLQVLNTCTGLRFYRYDGTTETYYDFASAVGTIPITQWVHVAVARKGGVMRGFVNGVAISNAVSTTLSYSPTSVNKLYLGIASGGGGANQYYRFPGYIDDARVTNGIGRYTATFTPPTSQLQDQ